MTKNRWIEQYFLIFVVLALFSMVILPLATPVVLGFLVAMVFYSVNSKVNQLLGKRPVISALVTTFVFTICVVLPLVLIGILAVQQASGIAQIVATSVKDFDLENSIELIKNNKKILNLIPFTSLEIRDKLELFAAQAATWLAQVLASFLTKLPLIGLEIFVFILSFYYGLVDGARLTRYLARCLPFEKNEVSDLFNMTKKVCKGVVVGSVAAGLAQGIVIGGAYWILGIPGALLFGSITATLSFIPMMGSGPTGIGGILYLLSHGNKPGAIAMLVALALASVSDNIVKPIALKGSVELHPLLGLVSALGALAVFGVVGLFLGPLFSGFLLVSLDMLEKRNSDIRPR